MKSFHKRRLDKSIASLLALAGAFLLSQTGVSSAAIQANKQETVSATADASAKAKDGDAQELKKTGVIVQEIEPAGEEDNAPRKERPWLGVYAEEASEALASQLGLAPGVGLLVTYVATNSPAALAGLQKNDVLVEFNGQPLVLPSQLRKMVQVRKEGETVKLEIYRGGKKKNVSATLAKAPASFASFSDEKDLPGGVRDVQRQLKELFPGDGLRQQMEALRDSLGNMKFDQNKAQEDIRRGMEEASKALQDIDSKKIQDEVRHSLEEAGKALQKAIREATNAAVAFGPAVKTYQDYLKSYADADNDASVTVRSTSQSVKSIVKSDDSGTIVIVSNPKLRLTAHDKDGKLLFDGEIETAEQRHDVPGGLWQRVEPLLNKLNQNVQDEQKQ
jgi:PDZ domain-containing protein